MSSLMPEESGAVPLAPLLLMAGFFTPPWPVLMQNAGAFCRRE